MPPYDQPKILTPQTIPTKLRDEITELKKNIAEKEEVLKSYHDYHKKYQSSSEGATPEVMPPEAWTAFCTMVSSESQCLNLSKGRLYMLEEKLAKAEQVMELRAKRMSCLLSFCLL